MTTTLSRRLLSDALLAALATAGKPVGDMTPPPGWGWDHQPNLPASTFTPFVVLSPLMASRSAGPFGDPEADWVLPYMVESFGSSREQCEWMADQARSALDALVHTVLDLGASYAVQQVRADSLGAVNKVMVTDPPFFGVQDGVSVWLAKELT